MRSLIWIAAVVFAVAAIFMLLYPHVSCGPLPAKVVQSKNDAVQISMGLRDYKSEFGVYPSGNQSQIIEALRGKNPKGIVFIEPSERQINQNGEFIDSWGYPFQIDFSFEKPHVWSLGKNHTNEKGKVGSDDLSSWN